MWNECEEMRFRLQGLGSGIHRVREVRNISEGAASQRDGRDPRKLARKGGQAERAQECPELWPAPKTMNESSFPFLGDEASKLPCQWASV